MSNTFYLAIRHDRHTDDIYALFETLELAQLQCKVWTTEYPSRYVFEENTVDGNWCLMSSEDHYVFVKELTLSNEVRLYHERKR